MVVQSLWKSFEFYMFSSLQVVRMRVDMLLQPREEVPKQPQMCLESKWIKLFTPIASNKNGCKSNKNLETMTSTTNAQLPKKIVDTMIFAEMRHIRSLEMGN